METVELFVPCHFGLEAVLKREIADLGYEITEVTDGRVSFKGDISAIARCNVFLRTTERVMLKVGNFKALEFDEFFEKIKALPWERYIPKDGKFWVKKASSIKSKLFSSSDLQSLAKKAIVNRLSPIYRVNRFEETGSAYPIRISAYKDEFLVGLDTSGASLHKRGYRKFTVKAPITETLAAALISLTPWNKDRILIDPFCGSGTIPIEAAMIGLNIAPGMARDFEAMAWSNIISKKAFVEAKKEAKENIDRFTKLSIQGYDIDSYALDVARKNAELAGISDKIHFQQRDVKDLKSSKKYGFIITNPPYGERLDIEDMSNLYKTMGEVFDSLSDWSYYIITSFEDAPEYFKKKPDKNRKIYNGMLKTYFYSFMGAKPPKIIKHT